MELLRGRGGILRKFDFVSITLQPRTDYLEIEGFFYYKKEALMDL